MTITRIIATLTFILVTFIAQAQSKTTQKLQSEYEDSFSLFFYNNTLRMINQSEDKEFDDIIRDIEKMKLLIIRKNAGGFDFKRIVQDYKQEAFEEIMTSRHEGKNFDIYLKEKEGKTKAVVVLVNDDENLFVLDILGSIAPAKVAKLYSVMDQSADIGNRVKRFIDRDKENKQDETGKDEAKTKKED
jgi:Domain of unknown function (DUF4252)